MEESNTEIDIVSLHNFNIGVLHYIDPITHALVLLGSFPRDTENPTSSPAIVRVEKTTLSSEFGTQLSACLGRVEQIEKNGIYTWFFGWLSEAARSHADLKINIIVPATETHIRKYSKQDIMIVNETPYLYHSIVKPFISALPPSRTQWVEDILSGKSEADKVLFKDPNANHGFIILPDMKWDLTTLSSLYLVAIVLSKEIRCLRDLRKVHIGMLCNVRREAARLVKEKWGLNRGSLRLTIVDHFHVHIVNANYVGLAGMAVGQAHLLDDIISLLESDVEHGPSIFERMTLTYGLGDQHELYEPLTAAQVDLGV